MQQRFKGKVVVVTGGSSGIGLAAARAYANEGARVVITGRDRAALERAARGIGASAEVERMDAASVAQVEAAFAAIGQRHGRIDVLFANAGVGAMLPVEQTTEAVWDQLHDVNLKGAFFCVRSALPFMRAGSSILFTASLAAWRNPPGGTAYAASKAGVVALGRALADEFAGRGIRVNVISPGPVDTPLPDHTLGVPAAASSAMREMMGRTPLGRVGRPEEIADAALFLTSGQAGYITGIELVADGGIAAR
ncbi:MAG: SDR family oxidoreductase [Steroidobacteraceae bacterium]